MRTIESLEGLLQRVVAEDRRKHDVIADTRKMSVVVPEGDDTTGDVRLLLDTEDGLTEYVLSDHTLGQVSTDLGIPKRYFDRMRVEAPDLFRTNLHHWMYNKPKARMIRGLTNEPGHPLTARAWMSDKFRRLDHIEIARTLLPEFDNLGTQVEFHQAAVTEQKLYIRALFPQIQRDIKHVGDTVRWGVEIANSEIGAGSLTIRGFVLVLACTNGMTVAKSLNARHVGKREGEGILSNEALAADDTAFWLAARDTLRYTCTETAFNEIADRLQDLSEIQVVSPVAATKVLAKEHGLSEAEEEAVMLSLAADPNGIGRGQWGMLNALTAAAQTVESFDRQAEIEAIGWNVAQMTDRDWSKVAAAVR
jgi:hypothetical protein